MLLVNAAGGKKTHTKPQTKPEYCDQTKGFEGS